jgi:protease-4
MLYSSWAKISNAFRRSSTVNKFRNLVLQLKRHQMLSFLKNVLATIVGIIASFFILIFLGAIIGAAISGGEEQTVVKENSILKITLDQQMIDRGLDNPIDFDFFNMQSSSKLGLNDVLESIEKAKQDDNIKGIYLNIEFPNIGMATLEELRNKLQSFKDSSEKFILAYSEVYSQKAYYIASVADQLYLNPEGAIELKGLSYQGMFFKNALEKLEVEPQIIRHGKFKSAVEPYMLEKMSDANREQVNRFLSSMWKDFLNEVAEDRPSNVQELNKIAEDLLVQYPEDAISYQLADALLYKDQVLDTLKAKLGIDAKEDIPVVSLAAYKRAPNKQKKFHKDKVAVIYAQGAIQGGEGDDETIGSERISRAIREARTDEKVNAIVLRVNSPGGSALASETILREAKLAKAEKPFVVSMGDLAASGGYYIACDADTIVASPTTITGSIGVFGVLFNGQQLLNNKLGITIDTVKTGQYADMGSPFRSLTPTERDIIQRGVVKVYDTFITHVAAGRKMSKEAVDAIGQGRVWTGRDALELGLVDVLGGLEDAIEIAANMADLEEYRISNLPKQKDPMEELIKELSGQARASIIEDELGASYQYYKELKNILEMDQLQARMPYYFEIH